MPREDRRLGAAFRFIFEFYNMSQEHRQLLIAAFNGGNVPFEAPPDDLMEAVNLYLIKKKMTPFTEAEVTPGDRVDNSGVPKDERKYPDRITLRKFVMFCRVRGVYEVGEVTEELIRAYGGSIVGKNGGAAKHSTVQRQFDYIRSFLKTQVFKGVLADNPTPNREHVVELSRALTVQEIEAILGAIQEGRLAHLVVRDQLIIIVAFAGALRVNEVRLLRRKDLIVEDGITKVFLQFPKGAGGRLRRMAEGRTHPLVREAWDLLDAFSKDIKPEGYLFSANGGDDPLSADAIQRMFNRALDLAGIKKTELGEGSKTFHSLRHGSAVASIEVGNNLEVTRQLLRHLSDRSTLRYTIMRPQQLVEHASQVFRPLFEGRGRRKTIGDLTPRRRRRAKKGRQGDE